MSRTRATPRPAAGFTIVEATLSILIVSLMLVAAMQAAAGASLVQFRASQRALAAFYARALLSDITALDYQDAGSAPVFGREAGESSTSRAKYNDVDDYTGYTESPLTDRDGKTIANTAGWKRSVKVSWVNPADLSTAAAESGAKLITVTVSYNGKTLATRTAIRTNAP